MNDIRQSTAVFVAVLVVLSMVAPAFAAGGIGAASSSTSVPDGMVGVPDSHITDDIPNQASNQMPGASAFQGDTMTTEGASTMQVEISTEAAANGKAPVDDPSLAIEFTDVENSAGREVAVNASAVEEALGRVPELAYVRHSSGETYTVPIEKRGDLLVWELTHFSTNTVTFDGTFSINATPAQDGDQFTYNTSDGGENLDINVSGSTATEWENKSATGVGTTHTTSISINGNMEPIASDGGDPILEVTASVGGNYNPVDAEGDGGAQGSEPIHGDDGVDNTAKTEVQIQPDFDGDIEEITVNIVDTQGSDYGALTDVYIVQETADGTYGEGTKISTWDPDWTTGEQTITVDSPPTVASGTTYTLEFVTDTTDGDGNADRIYVGTDPDTTKEWLTVNGNIKQQFGDVTVGNGGAVDDLSVSDGTGTAADFGNFTDGETKTKRLNLTTDSTELNFTGTGAGEINYSLEMQERSKTIDPVVDVNGDTTSYTGSLADGEEVSLSANDSWIADGTNNVSVAVGDGTLSSGAPTPEVNLDYTHDVVEEQSVDYEAEAFSERYAVSKTWADDTENASITIPWASDRVIAVRSITVEYYDENGDFQSSTSSPDYTTENGELIIELGDVPAGWETRVDADGTKVQVTNGSITVTEPTTEGNTLDTKFQIDSKNDGFYLEVGGTADGDLIHYLYNESWSGADDVSISEANGKQRVTAPGAADGSTARIRTLPVAADPSAGEVQISVADNPDSSEPAFSVRGPGNGNDVEFTFVDAEHDTDYILWSKTNEVVRDSGTANSPITLTDDDSGETLVFLLDDDGGGSTSDGGSGGGGSAAASVGGVGFGQNALLLLVAIVLAGVWYLDTRFGSDSISTEMLFVAEAAVLGTVALEVLSPASLLGGISSGLEALLGEVGAGIATAMPLIVLVGGVAIWLWQRQKAKPDNVIRIGGNN